MLFSQIYGEVASNFPTANLARCKLAVNAAYHEFMSARQWAFSEVSTAAVALVAGQANYVLTGTTPVVTDFDGMIDVVMEMSTGLDRKTLSELKQADFDRVFGHVTTNGEPAVYCVRGALAATTSATVVAGGQTHLILSPPPLATATHGQQLILRYFRSVATVELTADSDVPLLPAAYHYALVVGANAYMAEAIGNLQKAMSWRQIFQQRIQLAMSEDEGMRLRDQQLLGFRSGASVYPITQQTPASFDLTTRPYDKHD